MFHAFPRTFELPSKAATTPIGALSPSAYLRLRREARGLSVDQVARLVAPDQVDAARDLIQQLETPGVIVKRPSTLLALQKAFPFDQDVYWQLAIGTEKHPAVCRSCGCSVWDPCVCGDGQDLCRLSDGVACSRCAGAQAGAQ